MPSRCTRWLAGYLALCCAISSVRGGSKEPWTEAKRTAALKDTLEMFDHAFDSYMKYAFPADELMPLSCKGRVRGKTAPRGDIDEALANYSLTLVDSLDTLYILGRYEQFEEAVRHVSRSVNFNSDLVVSVFELSIRGLGGLLSGHIFAEECRVAGRMTWYNGELLALARDLATRLLPAFNTTTGIPAPRVNLITGLQGLSQHTTTCTACAGSMSLEMATLSRLSGDTQFEAASQRALDKIWASRNRVTNLVGQIVNVQTGEWVRSEASVGAGGDSYYEYLLKQYILSGDTVSYDRFKLHYHSIQKYMGTNDHNLHVQVEMHNPKQMSRNFVDSLSAFWPGLQTLIGDFTPAIRTHEIHYQLIQRYDFLPEAFTTDFRIHWPHHPLRPEFIESTYFLYRATKDPYYLEVGRLVLDKLNSTARVTCGFAGIRDVTTGDLSDQMDSYLLAETFKYLYLLFSEEDSLPINIQEYVFTTEGHLLPVSTSPNRSSGTGTCPNIASEQNTTLARWAHQIRAPLKNYVEKMRPSAVGERLRAKDLEVTNEQHVAELRSMGIRIVSGADGRLNLIHSADAAVSPTAAANGEAFIAEMVLLQQTKSAEGVEDLPPRLITVLSWPHCGNLTRAAGPAQFGSDLTQYVRGKLLIVSPFNACSPIKTDPLLLKGRIAVSLRGGCLFVEKARYVEAEGAAGLIVMDNAEDTSSFQLPFFALSGDDKNDVALATIFLYRNEASHLVDLSVKTDHELEVILTQDMTEKELAALVQPMLDPRCRSSADGTSPNPAYHLFQR